MGTKVTVAATIAKQTDKNLVLDFLKRVRDSTSVELTLTRDEEKIALALVSVNLLKKVVEKEGAVK
eukprot:6183589-Amphidinium_carterae.1